MIILDRGGASEQIGTQVVAGGVEYEYPVAGRGKLIDYSRYITEIIVVTLWITLRIYGRVRIE